MDFVVGIRVWLLNNHNCKGMPAGAFVDICDELSAPYGFAPSDKRVLYPKGFKFTGWHPHCRCIATPVLKTMDELAQDAQRIMAGDEPTEGSANQVTDVPQGFKQWVEANQQRITTAKSLPYFIKDNKTWVDSLLHPQPRELTTLQKAKLRHDARTQEQADKLKQRWEEHNKEIANTRMVGANVLKVAKDYGDVDYSALEALVDSGNPNGMREAARAVAKQVQEAKKFEASISDLIPDAHKWHQQFTRAELQKAHDSVVAKLGYWKKHGKGSLTDGTDLMDLNHVAKKQVDYLKLNKNNSQITHPTWKVEAQAYEKVAKDALDKWHWQVADADLATLKTYKTSSKKFKELISAAQDAKKAGDLTLLRSKIKEAEKLKWDLEDKKAKAAAKKAAASSTKTSVSAGDLTASLPKGVTMNANAAKQKAHLPVLNACYLDDPKLAMDHVLKETNVLKSSVEAFAKTPEAAIFKKSDLKKLSVCQSQQELDATWNKIRKDYSAYRKASNALQDVVDGVRTEIKQQARAVDSFSYEWDFEIRAYQTGVKFTSKYGHKMAEIKERSESLERFIDASPKWDGGITCRGMSLSKDELNNIIAEMQNGNGDMLGAASWSTNPEVAEKFAHRNAGIKKDAQGHIKDLRVVFRTHTHNKATSIKHLSEFRREDEVLGSVTERWRFKIRNKPQKGYSDEYYIYIDIEPA